MRGKLGCRRRLATSQEGEMAYKFEIFKDKAGEFRVRFRASNGEVMFSSEGYAAKASAKNMIESIKKNAPDADVVDESAG
jgi:hypothetical protein|tara:strand:+ start:18566 stop:18805 length:240 start_codon:yes stop_codon:yes gene_type:complete